jgi:hypothetical protein
VNRLPFSPEMLRHYATEGAAPVRHDFDRLAAMNVRVIEGDYLIESSVARHDAVAVSRDLIELAESTRRANLALNQAELAA